MEDCIIELNDILLFKDHSLFGIIVLRRRRIRSVPLMELLQGTLGEDCLCTDSVISFSTECPDLGNWRLLDDTLWTKVIGGSGGDEAYSVQEISEDEYIIAGYTGSFGSGNSDVYLIRIGYEIADTLACSKNFILIKLFFVF